MGNPGLGKDISITAYALSVGITLAAFSHTVIAQCEVAVLSDSEAVIGDGFGIAVAISGDIVVIGSYRDDTIAVDAGSAVVFRRNGTAWPEEVKLTGSDGAADDWFGFAVSISGSVAVIGAPRSSDYTGSAYVYRFNGTEWIEEAKLAASDSAPGDQFGRSIAVVGDLIVVGAVLGDGLTANSGTAYIFRREGMDWIEEVKLLASDGEEFDQFGTSVSTDGDSVVVGASRDDVLGTKSGSAYVFRRNGADWVEEAKLVSSDMTEGDFFGVTVAVVGDLVLVGASGHNDRGTRSGSAYVFHYDGKKWIEEAKLLPYDLKAQDRFGFVALSGNLALIGAFSTDDACPNDPHCDSGSAYLFRRDGTNWIWEAKFTASDAAEHDRFGRPSLTGDYAVIGASSAGPGGAAYVYQLSGGTDCNRNDINDACDLDCNVNGQPDACDITEGLSQDCTGNRIPDECETDCNGNNVADSCDVADGTAEDCTDNLVLDECEPDCNGNQEADSCDIAFGFSEDLNHNSIPDECDGGTFALLPVDPPPTVGPYPPGVVIIDDQILLPSGGQRVWLEIQLSKWAPALLDVWQATIDSADYASGSGAPLAPAIEVCNDSPQCAEIFGPGSECEGGFCQAGFQNIERPDFIFQDGVSAVRLSTLDYRYGSVTLGDAEPDDGMTRYGGTLVLDVPPDAEGTYKIGFFPDSAGPNDFTFMQDLFDSSIELAPPRPALVIVCPRGQRTSCCLSSAVCTVVDPSCCVEAGGIAHEFETLCDGDADGDGIDAACGDACPDDPNKTDPEVCGCGRPEEPIDLDGDGVPDFCGAIPAMSEWGLLVLSLLLLITGKIYFGSRFGPPQETH